MSLGTTLALYSTLLASRFCITSSDRLALLFSLASNGSLFHPTGLAQYDGLEVVETG